MQLEIPPFLSLLTPSYALFSTAIRNGKLVEVKAQEFAHMHSTCTNDFSLSITSPCAAASQEFKEEFDLSAQNFYTKICKCVLKNSSKTTKHTNDSKK